MPVQLPKELLDSLQGINEFDAAAFIAVHEAGERITSIRINPVKDFSLNDFNSSCSPVPWSKYGFYLEKRPSFTFDPLFHAGCYYVQEASSMFLEQALRQTVDLSRPLKMLDLSAAPGGKSTHLQSLISTDSLLVSNEVIKARAAILKQNIIKWGAANVIVTNNDPQHFQKLEGFFDVIVVDAPCSGSGLIRKNVDAVNEWSTSAVNLCSGRQQRILSDVLPALKDGGVLIYSTCSYSKAENEDVADWLVKAMDVESIKLAIDQDWGIVPSASERGAEGYRFYPYKVKGEGFFLACFRKKGGDEKNFRTAKPELADAKQKALLQPWVKNTQAFEFLKHGTSFFALPTNLVELLSIIQSALYIQYAGTTIGVLMRDKLIPDHALALSPLLHQNIKRAETDVQNAIRYLQRQELTLSPQNVGWQVITFKNHPLGWINALPNRINNYYPKDLRILKQFYD